MKFDEAVKWLEDTSTTMIRAARRSMSDGTAAFPPQIGCGYEAFWLRDYAYMLAGDIGAFSAEELKASARLFLNAQRADGAMVDCVQFDGTPIYQPGYGSMGRNPVADGSQFAVEVVWRTYRHLRDKDLLRESLDKLTRGLNAVPRDATSGLVFIDPAIDWDRCPYGFTDTVRKTGAELFCSLLFVQACHQLSQLLETTGRLHEAERWQREAERVAQNTRCEFWDDEIGLFRAATQQCRQPDIWGSAFAAYSGVANPQQTQKIARYFAEHYSEIVLCGQIRHLPGGTYWEKAECPPDTYQNGAFWATPAGWFVWTLRHVDDSLAEQTIVNLANDFQTHGVYEWIAKNDNGRESKVPGYLASVTLPLEVLRQWNTSKTAS